MLQVVYLTNKFPKKALVFGTSLQSDNPYPANNFLSWNFFSALYVHNMEAYIMNPDQSAPLGPSCF